MKILKIDFINAVNFGGTIRSGRSDSVSGARPGEEPMGIELEEERMRVRLTKKVNGKAAVKYVPIFNVSGYEPAEEEPKKDEKKK